MMRGRRGDELVADREDRDAAVSGQPLVSAADQRVRRPLPHADRARAGELGGVDNDLRADLVGAVGNGPDVDGGASRILHRADAHHRRGAADGLDQRGTKVRFRLVLDPADGRAEPGAGAEPRVGDAREIGRHQEHLGGSRGQRRCDLAQTFAGSCDDGDRSLRRVQQRRSGIAEIVQDPGLGGV